MSAPASTSYCVIIPSYNSGEMLRMTVESVLEHLGHVIVVIDGSTDGSLQAILEIENEHHGLHVLHLPVNEGKGGAFLKGLEFASDRGFTHAVAFDSDGQHNEEDITRFIEVSRENPDAMILGEPVFGPDAPASRVNGRRVGNWWANLETLWGGINDSLFGFRIYPVTASIRILKSIKGGRRFDFDTQLAVRLYWEGVRPINLKTKVRYPSKSSGGVTHFHFLRDNILLTGVHVGLCLSALARLPSLIKMRTKGDRA